MLSHLRRRVAVITALTVLAALVPVLSNSASAAPATIAAAPGDNHTMVACPSGSAPAAGFTDTTSTDVDCIAMFGITKGVTATTYEPSASIPRWQMALYLTRTASLVGHTLGSGADQGFTDISGKSAEIQTGINQLKQLGITTGTTATTFSPDDNVTREQMAMFVNRLLRKTLPGPGGNSDDASTALGSYIVGNAGDSYNYTDVDGGSVTWEGHSSIVALYNLGVPGHDKTVTAFGPATDITRGEMATWLNNALDHTNARPAGLYLQLVGTPGNWANNSPVATVTYRDANFAPVSGQVVDLFSWANSVVPGNTNWSADGTCNLNANVAIVGNSLTKCTIDVGDPATNAYGNIAVGTLTSSVGNGGTTSFYAWTDAAATKYDNDLHADGTDSSTVNATSTALATDLVLTCDVNSNALVSNSTSGRNHASNVHHGTTVNITAQMSAAANGGVYAPVAQSLNRLTVVHTIYAPNSANVASATTSALYTDANGTATYSFTGTDPNVLGTIATTDDVLHSVLITDYDSTAGAQTNRIPGSVLATKPCHTATPASVPMVFDFQDTVTDLPATMTQAVNVTSYKSTTSALAPVARTSTVTMTDKFGDAVTGGTVVFHGDDNPIAFKNTAASSSALEINAWATNDGYAVNAPVCFTGVDGGIEGEVSLGTTYYIKTITAANPSVAAFSLTAGGALHTITGTPTVAASGIALAHPTFGCALRTVSPQGTASVAWNDATVNTSAIDTVGVTARQLQAITTNNAQSAAAEVHSSKNATRWIAPGAVALTGDSKTSSNWTETDTTGTSTGGPADDHVANHANDIIGHIVSADVAANSMVVGLNYGIGGTGRAATTTAVTGADIIEINYAVASFVAEMPVNSPICFETDTASDGGNHLAGVDAGTVYFVKIAVDGGSSVTDLTISNTRGADLVAGATNTAFGGTPTIAAKVYKAHSATACSPTTYTSYSWDDNDYFYLNSVGGVTSVPTSMAGFEGTYKAGATAGTLGLQNHLADGNGLAYTGGDLDGVAYQALAANKSIFMLGG